MRIVVVFPAPFGPRRPRIRPGEAEKEALSTASTLSNRLVTPSTLSTGMNSKEVGGQGIEKPEPKIQSGRTTGSFAYAFLDAFLDSFLDSIVWL